MTNPIDELKKRLEYEKREGPIESWIEWYHVYRKIAEDAIRLAEAYRRVGLQYHKFCGQPTLFTFADGYTAEEREIEVDEKASIPLKGDKSSGKNSKEG